MWVFALYFAVASCKQTGVIDESAVIPSGAGNFWLAQFPDKSNLVSWSMSCNPPCTMAVILSLGSYLFEENTTTWADESGLLTLSSGPFYAKVVSVSDAEDTAVEATLRGMGPDPITDWYGIVLMVVMAVVAILVIFFAFTLLVTGSVMWCCRMGVCTKGGASKKEYGSINDDDDDDDE